MGGTWPEVVVKASRLDIYLICYSCVLNIDLFTKESNDRGIQICTMVKYMSTFNQVHIHV